MVVVSGRKEERLREQVENLVKAAERKGWRDEELRGIGYTLQVGREAMEHRLGVRVRTVAELKEKLRRYLGGEAVEGVYEGEVKKNKNAMAGLSGDEEMQEAVRKWMERGKEEKLLEMWVKGMEIEWERLYGEKRPERVSLPSYAFARERYWVEVEEQEEAKRLEDSRSAGSLHQHRHVLHPLLHENTSDLTEQRFTSVFNGDESFLADHMVRGLRTMPEVAYLEMALEAVTRATGLKQSGDYGHIFSLLKLTNIVWQRPVIVQNGLVTLHLRLCAETAEEISYEVYGDTSANDNDLASPYFQGSARFSEGGASIVLEVADLQRECNEFISSAQAYEFLAAMGFEYGVTHQTLQSISCGFDDDGLLLALAKLSLPDRILPTHGQYMLHPSLLDGVFQAFMFAANWKRASQVPHEWLIPSALEEMEVLDHWVASGWVVVRNSRRDRGSIQQFDVDICDETGRICVRLAKLQAAAVSDCPTIVPSVIEGLSRRAVLPPPPAELQKIASAATA